MGPGDRAYLPALRFHRLTRFYDPLIARLLRERRFKARLVGQVRAAPGDRLLDLGCGTGTLTLMLGRAYPDTALVGLDPDAGALAIARRKAAAAGVAIEWREGTATAPPFAPASFDHVVSSLMFHHLPPADKRRAFAAVRELLRPGGALHVADWGLPQNGLMRLAFLGVQLLDGFAPTTDNVRGRLPRLMEEAGFAGVTETGRTMTAAGTLSFYRAVRPR
jgi:ubiquinone/menaquinone biosynthesis C-methylase UbiE